MDRKTCPKCQSADIDATGACLVCGFNPNDAPQDSVPDDANALEDKAATAPSGMIEVDYSGPGPNGAESPELPQWRVELSRRLHEIKQRREAGDTPERLHPDEGSSHEFEERRETGREAPKATAVPGRTPRRSARVVKTPASPDSDSGSKTKSTHETELPLFQPRGTELPQPSIPAVSEPDPKEIQNLIDTIIARQAVDSGVGESNSSPQIPAGRTSAPLEDRLILVSRTLSGLVDLIVVMLCTGACIFAADLVSGISLFDSKSLIVYSLLLVAIFFSYSIFFLAMANQTIGMMLTDLKVVNMTESRPRVRQLIGRCLGYVLSLSFFGLGLAWGCFDRNGRCLHDRWSHTHIVRL